MRAVALLALCVLAASGCTMPASGSGGVVISYFEPSFQTVYSGEPIDFRLMVENKGTVDADEVSAKIIGLDTWQGSSEGGNCDTSLSSLAGAVPSIGAPGGSANCKWTYVAPEVPKGLSSGYSPTARVYYSYNTHLIKSLFFAPSREIRMMMDRGESIPSQTASQTQGPISIEIKGNTPMRFWEDSVEFPIAITITNTGGGVVCKSKDECDSDDGLSKLTVNVDGGNDIAMECGDEVIELWQGKTNTMICRATFSGLSDAGPSTRLIRVTASYGYYVDKQAQVTVQKR